jgi:hypothetical protein
VRQNFETEWFAHWECAAGPLRNRAAQIVPRNCAAQITPRNRAYTPRQFCNANHLVLITEITTNKNSRHNTLSSLKSAL